MSQRAHTAEGLRASASNKRVRVAAILALAVAVALGAWLVFKGDDQGTEPSRAPASAVSATELRALPNELGHEVFWAGAKPGFTYELTQTTQGNVFLRYLPAGVKVK